MMKSKLAFITMMTLLLNAPVTLAADDDEKEIPKLAVRGMAELEKPADQLRLTIGVITENKDATVAMKENARRMKNVIKAIERAGLSDDEYETGQFRIMPRYSRRPRQPDPNWRPRIIDYEVTNTVNIKTKNLDIAAELIESASKAEANTIDSISFDLADQRKYRSEAIAEATRNAIADANVLAEASSLKLVRIMSITLDNARPQPPAPLSRRRMLTAGAAIEAATPISPGDVTIRATVNIVYEIAPIE